MQRYTVISADCHAGATDSQGGFTEYVDAAYLDQLIEHTAEKRREFNESMDSTTPFDASSGPGAKGADWELQTIGAWAYNRWLADSCALHPGRHGGIAVITVHDLGETVRQVTWAKEHGLRGVLLPAGVGALPFYNHPRYDPLWSVCGSTGSTWRCSTSSRLSTDRRSTRSNRAISLASS